MARVWELQIGRPAAQPDRIQLDDITPIIQRSSALSRLPTHVEQRILQQATNHWDAGMFSRDSELLVTFSRREQSYLPAQIWHTQSGKLIQALDHQYKDGIRSAAFSHNKQFLALSEGFGSTVRVWNLSNGLAVDLVGHTGQISSVALSPNNACVITGSHFGRDGTARVWHTTTGDLLAVLWGHTEGIGKVAFGPTGEFVITEDNKGKAQIFPTYGCASVKELNALANLQVARLNRLF